MLRTALALWLHPAIFGSSVVFTKQSKAGTPAHDTLSARNFPPAHLAMPKKVKKRDGSALRHDPLDIQLKKDDNARKGLLEEASVLREGKAVKVRAEVDDADDENVDELIPGKLSGKILKLAKEQQIEIERENKPKKRGISAKSGSSSASRAFDHDDDAALDDDDELEDGADDVIHKGDYVENVEISQDDEEALALFMGNTTQPRLKLADMILDKIREKEEAIANGGSVDAFEGADFGSTLSPKIVEVYRGVGKFMSRYSAGKVPKAFKIIPSLTNWEEVLLITRPDKWSSQAVFVATRLFASNLNAKSAQRFFNVILLDRVLEDISENKRLNYHLYLALKKVYTNKTCCVCVDNSQSLSSRQL